MPYLVWAVVGEPAGMGDAQLTALTGTEALHPRDVDDIMYVALTPSNGGRQQWQLRPHLSLATEQPPEFPPVQSVSP